MADLSMNSPAWKNKLFYGDNLKILQKHRDELPDSSVDLVYLDPPFKSNADYNLLFKEKDGTKAASQLKAFGDTWKWDASASAAYYEVVERGPRGVSDALQAFQKLIPDSDMLAYLAMMASRLVELRRVLKNSGTLYLHCDPTASHYLKLLLDAVFGPDNFRNEIVWKRTYAHGSSKRFGPVHDIILFYTKSDSYKWNRVLQSHNEEYLEDKYRFEDERGRYRLVVMTGPGTRKGASGEPWRGYDPTAGGRHWAVPGRAIMALQEEGLTAPISLQDQLDFLYEHGLIRFPEKRDGTNGVPEFKLYLPQGQPAQDIILDIPPINSQAQERLGYPTQNPKRCSNDS
jgi:DNA modification methylase